MNCSFNLADNPETLLSVLKPLRNMLRYIEQERPDLCNAQFDYQVRIKASFRKEWGLGSSSALIANLAQWAQADPFALMRVSFPGSGYDVATAFYDQAVLYRLEQGTPHIKPIAGLPEFLNDYRVVFMGKKVNSRESVADVQSRIPNLQQHADYLDKLGMEALNAVSPADFNAALTAYEQLLSEVLAMSPTGSHFPEYPGFMKSLGAWGGDALLVSYVPDAFEQVFGHLNSFKLEEIAKWS
jgi:mevalonate kinase